MQQFNYNPIITGRIIKTKKEQFDAFFYQGHPLFLIPDFYHEAEDIDLSFTEYLEKINSCELYDQEGGEVHSYQIVDKQTGLTKCIYSAYGIQINANDIPQDFNVEIKGYVVEHYDEDRDISDYIFIATNVIF